MKGRALQAHFAKVKFQIETIISFAKRACKDQTQRHQDSFSGTFAA